MQFLNHTYYNPVLFGHRILISLKDFIFYKKIFTANVLFEFNTHTAPLFKDSNIMKFPDKIALGNCIFIKNYFNQSLQHLLKIGSLSLQIHIHIIQDGLI